MKSRQLLLFILLALVLLGVGLAITVYSSGASVTPRQHLEGELQGVDPAQGERAVVKYGCGGCHVIEGIRSARGKVGPPLSTMGERAYIAGNLPNTPPNLVLWIMNPQGVEPGTAMPDLQVSEDDARAIAAYLYSLE